MHTTLNDILSKVEKLPVEQQETLVEVITKRLIEERREKIAKNAETTLKAYRTGKAWRGSVSDLRKAMKK
ncbi:MAG: hypothetical protein AB1600_01095 [Bacteroidota bacterium]